MKRSARSVFEMATRRLFYVTQDSMVVWSAIRSGMSEQNCFQCTDEGVKQFADYMRRTPQQMTTILVDVIEEEFDSDTVPKLGRRDRNSLIERKLLRKFPQTPYRLGIYQGKSSYKEGAYEVLYAAISNPDLLSPWLDVISWNRTPLTGIHSVSLLAADLLGKLKPPAVHSLFLTQHQTNRLRQVYLQSGHLKSSRLSQSPPLNTQEYGAFIFTEIQRSRRYLQRNRLLGARDPLDVYFIGDSNTAKTIVESEVSESDLRMHFIDPAQAAKSLNISTVIRHDHLEALYLSICARSGSKHNYALRTETTHSRILMGKLAATVTAVAASVVCAVMSGIYFIDGLQMRGASALIDSQIRHLEETYRRENEKYQPIKADSHEMKLAVDTGNYILDNNLPVAWVLQQLGLVLGDHPDVHLDELNWWIEDRGADTAKANTGGQSGTAQPVKITEIRAVYAEVAGQIRPYDGNLRDAFRKIELLVESLRSNTAFDSVVTTELPIDTSPASSLRGEVSGKNDKLVARFRLNLMMKVEDGEQT